ncbi:hypothetical protein ACXDF8_24600 [Mycolicibacterium sp. CBM1]
MSTPYVSAAYGARLHFPGPSVEAARFVTAMRVPRQLRALPQAGIVIATKATVAGM